MKRGGRLLARFAMGSLVALIGSWWLLRDVKDLLLLLLMVMVSDESVVENLLDVVEEED